MGVRSAVLLSGVFIGFVVLYLVTRNQWNWIKLMRRLMLGLFLGGKHRGLDILELPAANVTRFRVLEYLARVEQE